MEKTVTFSVLKEKIIKTNELLHLHLDKTRELDKVQKYYQQLKTKLELSKNEINKFKLRDETLTYNLNLTEKRYKTLHEEHEQLKVQFSQLEKEFGETVNNLQLNYQQTSQELKECREKLSVLEENQLPVVTKPKSPVKKKTEPAAKDTKALNHKIGVLTAEKDKLVTENNNLKSEILQLKNQIAELNLKEDSNSFQDLKAELKMKQLELTDLQKHLKKLETDKNKEIDRLNNLLNKMEAEKKKLEEENDKLQNENCSYKVEMFMLQANHNNSEESLEKLNKLTENNKSLHDEINKLKEEIKKYESLNSPAISEIGIPTDRQIDEILKEVTVPEVLSPLTISTEGSLHEERIPSPHSEMPDLASFLGENNNSAVHSITFSETETITVSSPTKKSQIKSSSGKFSISSLSDIMRTSHESLRRRRRKKIVKKRAKKIHLYETLLALKKANINFIISNESLTHLDRISARSTTNQFPVNFGVKDVPEQKFSTKNVISKLECTSDHCKSCHMLLKGSDDENSPLLGFFDVKNEKPTQPIANSQFNEVRWSMAVSTCKSKKKRKKVDNIETVNKNSATCDFVTAESDVSMTLEPESITEINESRVLSDSNFRPNNIEMKENNSNKTCRDRKKQETGSVILAMRNKKTVQHPYGTRTTLKTRSCEKYDDAVRPARKRIAHTPNRPKIGSPQPNEMNVDPNVDHTIKLPVIKPKPPQTTFKRPMCTTRRSLRLLAAENKPAGEEIAEKPKEVQEDKPPECPRSPSPSHETAIASAPKVIPLEALPEHVGKMQPTKIEVLFVKLINYSTEEAVLNEVVQEFSNQDPEYIAQAILEKISKDYHDAPDCKYRPAPLMTETQRTMLGFMSKLEKSNIIGVFDSYLTLAEHRLLTRPVLEEIAPITRLYLAVCKLHKDLHRMRKLCCDVFYFCGDFAVPFLFYVLVSWTEVLPHEANSKDMPLARVLVQIVYMKDCNKPGYNLLPLRDLLIKFYGYPSERWDSNEMFQELFHAYLRNPVRSSDFALLLFCKNHPEKWVYDKIEEHLKPIVDKIPAENFKAAVIILIGNLYHRFNSKSETNYLPSIRQWLMSLITESTPDVVKRSVYLCLNRLAKK